VFPQKAELKAVRFFKTRLRPAQADPKIKITFKNKKDTPWKNQIQ
jgi:hypothetical protein